MSWFSRSPAPDTAKPLYEKPLYVHPDGAISCFIFQKRKLTANGKPKPHVFEQERHPEHGRLETSVCGMTGVSDGRLWTLGESVRAPLKAIAAVELPVASVVKTGLECVAAPEPNFDEHGVIVGWDEDDKSKRLAMQQELAAAHTAVRTCPSADPALN